MDVILTIAFFILGISIGSFLNVVIYRFNTGKSFGGRSKCLHCNKKLNWYDLFPLFSFLFLGGRCRGCKVNLSLQYPIVELLTGIVFSGIFLKFRDIFFLDTLVFSFSYAFYSISLSLLIVIAVYDLKHKIIPDVLSFVFGLMSFLGLFFFSNYLFFPHIPNLFDFLSGLIVAIPFVLLWFFSKGKWMGLGDAKLALGIGWFLPMLYALSSIVFAFWVGAIFSIFLILFFKKYGIKSEIPFAPFLVFGVISVFLLGFSLFPLF